MITRVSYLLIFLLKKIEEEVHKEENKGIERKMQSGIPKLMDIKIGGIKLGDNFVEGFGKGVIQSLETYQK